MQHNTFRWPIRMASAMIAMLLCVTVAASAQAESSPLAQKVDEARAAYDRGEWDDALSLYNDVYARADAADISKAEAALESASIMWERGSYARAEKRAEEALELARENNLDQAVGRLMVTLGHIEASQGKFSSARKTFRVCTKLSKEQGDQVFGAICEMNLSLIDKVRGGDGMSDAEMRRAIKQLEGANTPLAVGSAIAKTGELYAENKDYGRALTMLEKAQAQFAAAGSVPAQARNRLKIARVLQESGDYARSRAHIKMAMGPLKKMKNRPALVNAYGLLGSDAKARGDRSAAIGYFRKALDYATAISNPQLRAQSHLALCEALADPTPMEGAEHHCAQASTRFDSLGVPELEVRAKIARANLAQRRGAHEHARQWYKEVVALMEELPASSKEPTTLATQRANLCQVNNILEVTGTLLSCKKALEALTGLENSAAYTEHIATTYYVAGFAAQREERIKESLRFFEQASFAYMKLNPARPIKAADARLRMGLTYSVVMEGEDEAVKAFKRGLSLIEGVETANAQAKTMATQLRQQLIQVLFEQKKWGKVEVRANDLVLFADRINDPAANGWALNYLAQARLKQGDREGAVQALQRGVEVLDGVKGQEEMLELMRGNLKKFSD